MALRYSSQVYFGGEEWTPFSLMQLGGFVMGTLGTLLYGRGDAAEQLQAGRGVKGRFWYIDSRAER